MKRSFLINQLMPCCNLQKLLFTGTLRSSRYENLARRANIGYENDDLQSLRITVSEKNSNDFQSTISKSAQVKLQPRKSLIYRLATHRLVGPQLSNLLACNLQLAVGRLATCCLTIRNLLPRNSQLVGLQSSDTKNYATDLSNYFSSNNLL